MIRSGRRPPTHRAASTRTTTIRRRPTPCWRRYDYGGREIVFEVRGLLTGGEGVKVTRRPGPPADGAVAPPTSAAPTATAPTNAAPMNIMIGNLFYGTEGWAAMSDQGFQAFKGESNELIMEERPDRSVGDPTGLHMQNFLAACKSRNYKDLHDEIGNAWLSASLCHMANISYRTGRKLTVEAGPKFANDAEANKMITREYRKALRRVSGQKPVARPPAPLPNRIQRSAS